jgi:hypothetical protein
MEPRLFPIKTSTTGKRKYVVGSFRRVADNYWRKAASPHSNSCWTAHVLLSWLFLLLL